MEEKVFNEMLHQSKSVLLTRVCRDMESVTDLLCRKSKEYSTEDNKFHNFDLASEIFKHYKEETEVGSALGMLKKHLVSIIDIIQQYEQTGKVCPVEILNEKFGDTQAYLFILKIMLENKIDNNKLGL